MNTSWGTHCPACGAVIGDEPFCPWCGLDLQGSDAADMRGLVEQVRVLDERIDRIAALPRPRHLPDKILHTPLPFLGN